MKTSLDQPQRFKSALLTFCVCFGVLHSLNASAENQCRDLQKLLSASTANKYVATPLAPAQTLNEARKISKRLLIQTSPSFLALSDKDQLKQLNTVNSAISLLPPIVLEIMTKARTRIVLVGDSFSSVPEVVTTLQAVSMNDVLTRGGVTIGDSQNLSVTTYIVTNELNQSIKSNGLARVVLHELGHAFDHSIGILNAKIQHENNYAQYTRTSSDFDSAHAAALHLIKGSGIETAREFFADMFFFYFGSEERRQQQKNKLPETYKFFENWFGESCRKE